MSETMGETSVEFKLSKVGIIMLGVSDLARSKAYYCDQLGMEVQTEFEGFVFLNGGGVTLALNTGVWNALGKQPGATNVVFQVESVKAAYEGLLARDVEFMGGPINVNGPQWAANFRDPDGHLLSVFGPE